jgi:hypothetical protein
LETEINFGGEGGLYAELLPNRDLETLGERFKKKRENSFAPYSEHTPPPTHRSFHLFAVL